MLFCRWFVIGFSQRDARSGSILLRAYLFDSEAVFRVMSWR